jgi:drug/metabolite transporter (DMT)-like permease
MYYSYIHIQKGRKTYLAASKTLYGSIEGWVRRESRLRAGGHMKEAIAVILAFTGSFLTNYSTYLQKIAVDRLPMMEIHTSWQVVRRFLTNIPWIAAMAMDGLGTALYMVALVFLPVSIVEPILTAGIALLAYLAITRLGEKPRKVDYAAIAMTVSGVVFLAVSLAEGVPQGKTYHAVELWFVTAAILCIAIAVPVGMNILGKGNVAAGLGFTGGLLIGIAGVYSRLLMGNFGGNWYIWIFACLLTYPTGFLIFQAGLQRGKAVVVAPIYNGLVMCVPVVVGMVALNESLPRSALLTACRIVSFALIIAGTIILSRGAAGEALEKSQKTETLDASTAAT